MLLVQSSEMLYNTKHRFKFVNVTKTEYDKQKQKKIAYKNIKHNI